MNSLAKTRNLPALGLTVIAVASLVWAVTRQPGPREDPPAADVPVQGQQDLERLQAELERIKQENKELRERLASRARREEPASPHRIQPPAADAPQPADVSPFASILDDQETLDEVKAMVKEQQALVAERQVQQKYADLLDGLDLSDPDRETFRGLLERRHLAEIMSPLEMMFDQGLEFDPQQLDGLLEVQQSETAKVDAEIRQFLSPENTAAFEYHRDTLGARSEVESVQRRLGSMDLGLNDTQRSQLVGIIHDAQGASQIRPEQNALLQLKALQGNPEEYHATMEQKLDASAKAYNQILDASAAILDADQHAALMEHYQSVMNRQEREADMSEAMAPLFRNMMEEQRRSTP